MTEHHAHHHDIDIEDLDGLKPQEIASMRWQAIEAFNSAPGLSPMARRVGIALINAMDAKTRNCFPSARRIAAILGVEEVSVKNAKAELGPPVARIVKRKATTIGADLISWHNPGGPRHVSHYSFNWTALLRLSDEAKTRGKKAMEERRRERSQGSEMATNGTSVNSSETATIEVKKQVPKVAVSNGQGSHLDRQGSEMATPKVAKRLPELSLLTNQYGTAQHQHAIASDGGLGCAKPIDDEFSAAARKVETKGALEKVREARKPLCFFDSLTRQFKDEPVVLERIGCLGFEAQTTASSYLATKGADKARAFILRKAGQ